MLVTTGRPTVSVPVLSNTIASIRPACSRCEPPLTRMPRRAPLPIAALIAVGVDNPTAHGQAISSIVIARRTSPVNSSVNPDSRNDAGTNRREKFCATVWIGARSCWASSTRAMIRPITVSVPTAVARTTIRPRITTDPACTRAPAATLTGRVSPVIADWSTIASPSTISPSIGIATWSWTITWSPACRVSIGTCTSEPSSRRSQAVSAVPRSSSEIARRVRRRVRSCRYSPMLSSHSTVSATTFSRSTRLATVAAVTSASVPALPDRIERSAPRRNGYPMKMVAPVATNCPLGPSSGGRANT